MATLTLTIDPELLAAAKLEADRRHITLNQFVAESLSIVAQTKPTTITATPN